MKTKTSPLGLVLLLCSLASANLLSGCAFGDRIVSLSYEPVLTQKAATNQKVAILTFADKRPVPEVGVVRNGFGMTTAKVLAPNQQVGEWVANAMATELTRAGFDAQVVAADATSTTPVVIYGEVTKVSADLYMVIDSHVEMQITVKKGETILLQKKYLGGAAPVAWIAATGEYQNALTAALQDLMKHVVPDVITAIEK